MPKFVRKTGMCYHQYTFLTKTNMSNKRGGLLFGVIVGTLLGVLFAPKKGKELRKEFQNEVNKGGLGTETLKRNFKEMGSDMAETAQEVYAMPEVQEQVQKGKKHVGNLVKNAESQMHKAGEKVGEKVKEAGEKYLNLDEEKMHEATEKFQSATKNVGGKLKAFGKKFMGNLGFTKKPISKSNETATGTSKTSGTASKSSHKKRSRKVKIQKKS